MRFLLFYISFYSLNTISTIFGTKIDFVSSSIGGSVLLKCDLDFPGGLVYPYTVHWYKQGVESHVFLRQEGKPPLVSEDYVGRSSLVGASLHIGRVLSTDFGLYECRVFVQRRNDVVRNSSWVLLEVNDQGLRFVREPQSVLLLPGASHVLECRTEPPTELEWKFDGRFVRWDERDGVRVDGEGLFLSSDQTSFLSLRGKYQCVAVLGNLRLGSRVADVSVAVLDEFLPKSNVTLTKRVGGHVLVPCDPPNSVPRGILRLENVYGSRVGPSDRVELLSNGFFKISSLTRDDAGAYRCSMENPALKTESKSPNFLRLNVEKETEGKSHPPQLVVSPDNFQAVPLGHNLSLHCYADGDSVVSWTKYGGRLLSGRHVQNSGTLSLYDIRKEDEGTYVCRADNGVAPPAVAFTIVEIEDPVKITTLLADASVDEGGEAVFDCNATGVPVPTVTWLHDGVDVDSNTEGVVVRDNRLVVRSASMSSAGFYQCFAGNHLGTESSTARLRVLPRFEDEVEPTPKPTAKKNVTETPDDAGNLVDEQHQHKKRIHHKKYNKKTNQASNGETLMVPPTAPQVTKLSDESVMVRWEVPENDGLAIQFFKVQYKDVSKTKPRWMTIDDEIAPHIDSFEVPNLKTGHAYRFRIAAVYSNNDNNQGPVSAKFVLHKEPRTRKPTVGPNIIRLEAVSPNAILLHWQYMHVDYVPIEGFFVYYRATTTAAYYTKTTVMGANSRSHIVSFLLPDTTYEIKMQCFNEAGTSDFSNIFMQKTPKSEEQASGVQETRADQLPPVVTTHSNRETLYIAIGAVLGKIILVLLVSMVYCNWKQRQQRRQLLATLDETIRGHNDMELSAVKHESNGILPNGHQIAKESAEANLARPFLNNNGRETEPRDASNTEA